MAWHELTITVPKTRNDGSEIFWQDWKTLEQSLLAIADGFSKLDIQGVWRSPDGIRYDDACVWYRILADITKHRAFAELDSVAEYVKAVWWQESVLITVTTINDVRFV